MFLTININRTKTNHCIAKVYTKQSYFEQPVLLAEFNGLLPAVVALVKVRGNASEFYQFMLLQLLGQCNVVKVIEGIN